MAGRSEGVGRPRPGRKPFPFPPFGSLPPVPPSASASASASASPEASGSPGIKTATAPGIRSDGGDSFWEAVPEAGSPAVVLPWHTTSPAPRNQGSLASGTTFDRRIPVLTLGVGLTLMGAGFGFLGLRFRRH